MAVKLRIPSPLLSYTRVRDVIANGETLGALLSDLDRQFPGIRFRMIDEQDRIRPHMRVFVDGDQVFDLARPVGATQTVQIIQALSGG
jgi:molybdopterin converting factor small subunit